jgi:hypothetical protein
MALTKLVFQPGINRETTAYANEGGWWDSNLVRFRAGRPESIGGWSKYTTSPVLGTGRSLLTWTALDGTIYTGLGTNLKYYLIGGSQLYDITPIRETTAAGAVTFAATNGSATITVTDTNHGATVNDFVTFSGASGLGGNITPAVLNREYQITQVLTASTYRIVASVTANASDTGNGGGAVVGAYQINTGLDEAVFGTGWGAGAWGVVGWGLGSTTTIPTGQLRIWSQENYGQNLVSCVRDGGIYFWEASLGLSVRSKPLSSLPGAQAVPTVAKSILVSERERHIIAFGCDPEASPGIQDPLVIRFSDGDNPTEWRTEPPSPLVTTAGELRIGSGSEIIGAIQTKQQIVVFTDVSVHAMQYVGDPFTFGLQEVSSAVSIISSNAMIAVGDVVYWMGKNEFYAYDGAVTQIPCTVKEYVFSNLNIDQQGKVYAGHASSFSEVWWFYPSATVVDGVMNSENDRYVVYNYEQRIWYYGTIPRTAWQDRGVLSFPTAVSPDGYVYYHEAGLNDGSANPPAALTPYIESSVIDMGDGDQFMFATRIIPDLTFRNSTNASPTVTLTLKARNFPGGAYFATDIDPVTKTTSIAVEQFTNQVFTRLRGRSMSLRIESAQVNTAWRLGDPRIDLRTDGRK